MAQRRARAVCLEETTIPLTLRLVSPSRLHVFTVAPDAALTGFAVVFAEVGPCVVERAENVSQQSASGRQRFQPRYNRIRRLFDGILRRIPRSNNLHTSLSAVAASVRTSRVCLRSSLAKVPFFARLAA